MLGPGMTRRHNLSELAYCLETDRSKIGSVIAGYRVRVSLIVPGITSEASLIMCKIANTTLYGKVVHGYGNSNT